MNGQESLRELDRLFLLNPKRRKLSWRFLSDSWLERVEGGNPTTEQYEQLTTTTSKKQLPHFELHGRTEQLQAAIKLICIHSAFRVERQLQQLGRLSTFDGPWFPQLVSGSGRNYFCHSLLSSAPWIDKNLKTLSTSSSNNNRSSVHSIPPLSLIIDVADYTKGSDRKIFSSFPNSQSPSCSHINFSIPSCITTILHNTQQFLSSCSKSDASLEGQLKAITVTARLLQSCFLNYLSNVITNESDASITKPNESPGPPITVFSSCCSEVHETYLASGGGIVFVYFVNLGSLISEETVTSDSLDLSILSSPKDMLTTSRPHVYQIISRLLEKYLVLWNNEYLPIMFFTATTDNAEAYSISCHGRPKTREQIPGCLVNRPGGFEKCISLPYPLSYNDRSDLLKYFVRNVGCSSINVDLFNDLVLSTSGFQPPDFRSLIHSAVHFAILDLASRASNQNEDPNQFQTKVDPVVSSMPNSRGTPTGVEYPNSLAEIVLEQDHLVQSLSRISPSLYRSSLDVYEFLPVKSRRWLSLHSGTASLGKPFPWGLSSIIGELELVKQLEAFARQFRSGLNAHCGIIICGESGSGKSHVAKSLADACECNLLIVQSADLMHSKLGDSEKAIAQLFHNLRKLRPCIALLESIEILCPKEASVGVPITLEDYREEKQIYQGLHQDTRIDHMGRGNHHPSSVIRISEEFIKGLDDLRFSVIKRSRRNNKKDLLHMSETIDNQVAVVMTTQSLNKVNPRLLQAHRNVKILNTTAASGRNYEDLLNLFFRHLPHEQFNICSKWPVGEQLLELLSTWFKQSGLKNPSGIVRLTEAVGLSAVIRRLPICLEESADTETRKKILMSNVSNCLSLENEDFKSTTCSSNRLCICDVLFALSYEKIDWT